MNNLDNEIIKIGVVGDNKLSTLLVERLLDANFELHLLSSPEKSEIDNLNVEYHQSIPSLVIRCSVIFTILSDGPALENALFSDEGMLRYLSNSKTIIDMSSVSPELIKEISEELLENEIPFLDATIINEMKTETDLIQMILVGGEEHIYKSVLPVFESIANDVKNIGENGASQFYRQAFGVRSKK